MSENKVELSPRESEIQTLCKGVLEVETEYTEDTNGNGEYYCPLCYSSTEYTEDKKKMDDIKHDKDCAYLIAEGLTRNFNK